MKFSILFSLMLITLLEGICQKNDSSVNEFSIAIPVLYNKTTVTNIYGPTREISGTGVSSGIGVYYKRILSNGVYGKFGLGYFAQNYSIRRPYKDFDFTSLLNTTRKYTYYCWEQAIGIGYKTDIKNNYLIDFSATYHRLNSFKQKYTSLNNRNITVTRNNYHFASMILLTPSIQRKFSNKINISAGILVPVFTSWKKDERFDENRNDKYNPSIHMGLQFGVHYKF